METRMKVHSITVLILFLFAGAGRSILPAQTVDRWSLGVRGGVNVWLNSYETKKISGGGEILVKYGFSPYVSAGLLAGFDALQAQNPPRSYGLSFNYLEMNTFPVAVIGVVHPLPGKRFTTYLYAGGGTLIFQRTIQGGTPYPDKKFHFTYLALAGVGLEYFTRSPLSVIADLGVWWIDKNLDDIPTTALRVCPTLRLGTNFYFSRQTPATASPRIR